ncbi:MAG: Do family serine endopeptidase [Spirochaetaceae bacterium]|jgi:Do/DeqQ family serine protease|nr:Do family serine endopeptidase [Spirochaetaceae bacterium]
MNLAKKLSSKNFFLFNLVLLGVIFGFSLAFLSFSCSTPQSKRTARAEENPIIIPENALSVAEGLQSAFSAASNKILPSVVELKTVSTRRQSVPNGIPWEFFFGPRQNDGLDGQEREQRSQGLGSGIIVRQNKDTYYVLTNYHVVENVNEIVVVDNNGKEFSAELIGKDDRRDLAMVSFRSADSYPLAVLADSDAVKVGDWTIAVGNPLGFMSSVTMGIVSAVGRTPIGGGPGNNINDFIQTDASINQGNSGGALVNIRGEVIGINTWIATNGSVGGSIGLGFAIPINNAKRSIDEFITSGVISYGWLGVSLTDPDRDLMKALNIEGKRGALATQVFLGSPADKAGIRPGDFITHVNGKETRGMNPLTLMVGDLKPGDKAKFTAVRDGIARDFDVRIEARTDTVAGDNKKLWPGVYIAPLSDTLRDTLKIEKSAEGLYVSQIIPETPAAIIGLQRGDLITGINGEPIKDIAGFYKLLREKTDKELWFNVVRGTANLETLKFKR